MEPLDTTSLLYIQFAQRDLTSSQSESDVLVVDGQGFFEPQKYNSVSCWDRSVTLHNRIRKRLSGFLRAKCSQPGVGQYIEIEKRAVEAIDRVLALPKEDALDASATKLLCDTLLESPGALTRMDYAGYLAKSKKRVAQRVVRGSAEWNLHIKDLRSVLGQLSSHLVDYKQQVGMSGSLLSDCIEEMQQVLAMNDAEAESILLGESLASCCAVACGEEQEGDHVRAPQTVPQTAPQAAPQTASPLASQTYYDDLPSVESLSIEEPVASTQKQGARKIARGGRKTSANKSFTVKSDLLRSKSLQSVSFKSVLVNRSGKSLKRGNEKQCVDPDLAIPSKYQRFC